MYMDEAFIEISAAPDLLSHDLSRSIYGLLRENYGRGVGKATHNPLSVLLAFGAGWSVRG